MEEQDGVLVQRVAQRLRGGVVERDGEVDVVDDGTDAAGDGRDRDGQDRRSLKDGAIPGLASRRTRPCLR